MVRGQPGRAALHADLRLVGQPDRSPLRAATSVRPRQQRPRQPPSIGPSAAALPHLAQRQHPRPTHPRRRTPPPPPHPQRATTTLGTTPKSRRMKRANLSGQGTSGRTRRNPSKSGVLAETAEKMRRALLLVGLVLTSLVAASPVAAASEP